ncbi:SAM-dependent methyltransferase, partial [Aeromonas salmonicida]
MDFNLQAYQADHLLHLSAKPERRLFILENAHHRWLEIDGVVQSAMSLAEPAALCLPHQQCIADLLPA